MRDLFFILDLFRIQLAFLIESSQLEDYKVHYGDLFTISNTTRLRIMNEVFKLSPDIHHELIKETNDILAIIAHIRAHPVSVLDTMEPTEFDTYLEDLRARIGNLPSPYQLPTYSLSS